LSLRGIKVLDVTHQIAGPWSTALLSDLGAEVIKVENPKGGDPARKYPFFGSSVFVTENRNKKSITLNLKSERGREIALKLASRCDIFVENLTPGILERLGLGYALLQKQNPRMIYCSISGYGRNSPYAERPSWDAALQAMSGLMSLTGEPESPPMRVGTSVVDLTAGVYAVCAILLALFEREKTGKGQFIDISLLDSAASLVNYWTAYSSITGHAPKRMGNTWPAQAPYQVFGTSDGYVFIGVSNDDFWKKMCNVLKLEHLVSDPRFVSNEMRTRNMEDLALLIEDVTHSWQTSTLAEELIKAGIPCSPVNTVDTMLKDASLLQRGFLVDVDNFEELKKFKVSTSPLRTAFLSSGRTGDKNANEPPPSLGQHTNEVLRDLGYTDSEIENLRKEGAI